MSKGWREGEEKHRGRFMYGRDGGVGQYTVCNQMGWGSYDKRNGGLGCWLWETGVGLGG